LVDLAPDASGRLTPPRLPHPTAGKVATRGNILWRPVPCGRLLALVPGEDHGVGVGDAPSRFLMSSLLSIRIALPRSFLPAPTRWS
jgi:hypothetical protein